MIFGEIVALLAVLGASGFGISAIVAYAKKADAERAKQLAHDDKRNVDLRIALKSRDYRQLDDWLIIYRSEITNETLLKQIQIRRDELYVEANP